MSDNIMTITHVLQKEFPNRAVEHRFAKNLHTFRLNDETAAPWLHVARDLVEQSDLKGVHQMLNLYSAADTLLASPEPKWLFINSTGVHEVEEGFGS